MVMTANTWKSCNPPRVAGLELEHRLIVPVLRPVRLLSALSTETLAERLFETPRLRWGLKGPPRWLIWLVIFLFFTLALTNEVRTSALQSRFFSYWASQTTYTVAPGASASIVFPQSGPFDSRLGYSLIPNFQRRLARPGLHPT